MKLFAIQAFFARRWVRWVSFVLVLLVAFGVGRLSALQNDGDNTLSARMRRATNRAEAKAEAAKDLTAALERLLKDPSTMTPEELAELAKQLDREQSQQLFATLNALQGPQREKLLRALMGAWSEKDPSGAISALHEMTPSPLGYSMMESALVFWGQKDPNAALKWLSENRGVEPSGVYSDRVREVMRGWAEKDPQGALQYAMTMPAGTRSETAQQAQMMRTIAATMAHNGDVSGALNLFSALPEGDLRNSAYTSIAREWACNDPQAALQWANSLGDTGKDYRSTILRSWSENDPASAAQWVASLGSDNPNKAEWMTQAVSQWSRYDLESPAQLLNSMPNSTEKDGAILAFTNRAAREDPESAIAWAGQVSSGEWRDRAVAMVGLQWSREDPEAFKSYVQTSTGLTADQKAVLQNVSQNGMRAIMQMGFPKTGLNGGEFNMEQMRSVFGGAAPGGGGAGGGGGGRRNR